MNEITIHGNLTADPVLRERPVRQAFLTFTVAVNRSYYAAERGTRVDLPAVFHSVIAFNQLADNAAATLAKGMTVTVTGYLADNSYTDRRPPARPSAAPGSRPATSRSASGSPPPRSPSAPRRASPTSPPPAGRLGRGQLGRVSRRVPAAALPRRLRAPGHQPHPADRPGDPDVHHPVAPDRPGG